MKIKIIRRSKKIFLVRFSITSNRGSWKLHIILGDDVEHAHTHPWNFSTFLLFGAYKEIVNGNMYYHKPFQLVHRSCTDRHQVLLYRVFGIKIPCITIGKYSRKIRPWCERTTTLCDVCQKQGFCADKAYWNSQNQQNDEVFHNNAF